MRIHLADLLAGYNLVRRLKVLGCLILYEYTYKIWASEPAILILKPIHRVPGLNAWGEIAINPVWYDNRPSFFGDD